MLRVASGFSYSLRVAAIGLITTVAASSLTATTADAKKRSKGAKSSHRAKVMKFTPPYSAIVVDANSGKVLHESNPDAPRHPASITKVMTLYLLFERLDAGKIALDNEMPVSPRAAAQAPSKLGLKPGQTLRVEDAIRALVTKSANDAAVVVAEQLGDSEMNFARMMTQKARALGMSHTLYRNASGLPNDEQITTARDQALLGRAVQDRFPKYYRYFSTASFTYKGRSMRNHNKLIGSMTGVDGIKTGYVNASGYNLLASIKRDGRHLVAVVMGGRSGNARDARMRELLNGHIKVAAAQRTAPAVIESGEIAVAIRTAPAAGNGSVAVPTVVSAPATIATQELAPPAAPIVVAAAAPTEKPEMTTATVSASPGGDIEPIRVKTVKVKASMLPSMAIGHTHTQPPTAQAAERPTHAPVADESKAATSVPVVVAKVAVQDAPAVTHANLRTPGSEWMIQVGALETQQDANERIANARAKAAKFLSKAKSFTEPILKAEMRLWRARFSGISKDDAEAACKTLKSAKIVCIALKN